MASEDLEPVEAADIAPPAAVPEGSPTQVPRRDGFPLFLSLFILMLVTDQAIKAWSRASLPPPPQWPSRPFPFPGILEFRLTYNEGIAFGLAQGHGGWFTPIAILISGGAAWYSFKHRAESKWVHAAMGLLAAGALGNLYDRLALGHVTDMFAVRFFEFPVFNWADSCITVATAILIIVWSGEALMHRPQKA